MLSQPYVQYPPNQSVLSGVFAVLFCSHFQVYLLIYLTSTMYLTSTKQKHPLIGTSLANIHLLLLLVCTLSSLFAYLSHTFFHV